MSVLNICLLCLQHTDDLFKVFGKRGIELSTGSTLKDHFWFEVHESDEKSICEKCWWTVQSFHDFYTSVKLKHQHQSIFDIKPLIVEATEHIEILELLHTIKDEPSIDIESDINDCSPDITDTPHSPAGESYMKAEQTFATDSPTIKRRKFLGASVSLSSKTTSSDITGTPNLATDSPTIKRRKRSVSDQYKTDSYTALLSTYFNMSCDLCDVPLSSYRNTMKHYKHVHNINKGYMICCSKKFFRLSYMLQHCQWHVNPDTFKCDHCSKNLSSKAGLIKHVKLCHAPEHEKVFSCNYCDDTFCKQAFLNIHMKKWHTSQLPAEGGNVHSPEDKQKFQCDICERSFAKSYYLTWHMKVKHVKDEDKQFECYICRKRFAVLLYLKGHINRIHRQQIQSHICEVCAKPFTTKIAYELHYRNIHTNISQEIQCDKCGKRLKHKQSLAKHLHWHRRQSKTETCAICGRVSSNIRVHMTNVHREATLECTICGKMFKKPLSLKEHMAIHSGHDLYKCKFCTKTFRSNANMYSHRKRAHSAELEQKKAS